MLVCLLGCDDMIVEPDAAPRDDAGTPITLALPSWFACPAGWLATSHEGASGCMPPPRVTCTGASFQPVGSAACEPIDPDCGTARFRSDAPEGRPITYVDASAGAGGDGSESAPYASLDDALRAGATGVLLAAGDYSVSAPLPSDLDLRGVCVDAVRIVAASSRPALLVGPGQRAALTGITITGPGIGPAARGTLVLDRVLLENLDGWGVGLNGGTLEAERVAIRGSFPGPSGGDGVGISAIDGSTATLRDVVIEDVRGVGIDAEGSSITAERVVVRLVASNAAGLVGGGISALDAASLDFREGLIADVHDFGIVLQRGATATLGRVVITDVLTASAEAEAAAKGIEVRDSTATLDRVTVARASSAGIFVSGPAASASISDLIVVDGLPTADFASAIVVEMGAIELHRALLSDATFAAVLVRAGSLLAEDLTVRRVAVARNFGSALVSSDGAIVVVTRFDFSMLHTLGTLAVGASSRLTLTDGTIAHVAVGFERDIGRAVEAHTGGSVVLRNVRIDDVVETAIVAFARDGLDIVPGTRIELTDVTITGIHERACVSSTCATEGGGTGVAALAGATVMADALTVASAPLCGVQVADGAELDVRSGAIETSAIGACIQIEGYDLARIVDGVRFVSNERNVETAGVYVPAIGPTF